jgi:hypothetical protein
LEVLGGALEKRLARVSTHLEVQTVQSEDKRHAFQESLFENHAIQRETIVVDIASLHPPLREPGQPMHPYQVRTIQKYFLQELTKKMELQGVSNLASSFILLVDLKVVKIKHKFVMAKKNTYKYFVLGGNHSACAKMDLARAHPHYDPYRRVSAWIFAGLSINDAR